jgi:hypothetical protein
MLLRERILHLQQKQWNEVCFPPPLRVIVSIAEVVAIKVVVFPCSCLRGSSLK